MQLPCWFYLAGGHGGVSKHVVAHTREPGLNKSESKKNVRKNKQLKEKQHVQTHIKTTTGANQNRALVAPTHYRRFNQLAALWPSSGPTGMEARFAASVVAMGSFDAQPGPLPVVSGPLQQRLGYSSSEQWRRT